MSNESKRAEGKAEELGGKIKKGSGKIITKTSAATPRPRRKPAK